MQLEGKQGPWPVCMGSLVILTPFLGGKATTAAASGGSGQGSAGDVEGIKCCSSWHTATCISKPDNQGAHWQKWVEAQTRGP